MIHPSPPVSMCFHSPPAGEGETRSGPLGRRSNGGKGPKAVTSSRGSSGGGWEGVRRDAGQSQSLGVVVEEVGRVTGRTQDSHNPLG